MWTLSRDRAAGPGPGPDAAPVARLEAAEVTQLNVVRRFGTVGALLMAAASLGAGANPVDNPAAGLRLLGLPSRMPTASLACGYVGIAMVVLAWLWLGRLAWPGRVRLISRSQLDRTLVMWMVPLVAGPPMFSKDVYSYLAQSTMALHGLDPYHLGPADALGIANPLVRTIPTIWRDTPAPYGPFFLLLGRGIAAVTGDNVVAGVLAHRALALAGVGMIVWALPRLARRVRVEPVCALWLGALNPLVLFHLVSGVHNEALMLGLLLVGIELALRGVDLLTAPDPGSPGPGPAAPGASGGVNWPGYRMVALGAGVVALGVAVKVPAALGLAFVGVELARRRGGRPADLVRAAAVLGGVAIAVVTAVGLGSGLGFGWVGALGTPNVVRSWLSPITDVGQLGGLLSAALGLGDHTESVLPAARTVGLAVSAVLCFWLLWRCFRGRVDPLTGLGAGFGAVVLLGPVVHPWYLLWAAIPLAASTPSRRYRASAIYLSAALAVLVPPTGGDFFLRAYVVPQSVAGAVIMLMVPLLLVRGKLPRARPAAPAPDPHDGPAPHDDPGSPTAPAPRNGATQPAGTG